MCARLACASGPWEAVGTLCANPLTAVTKAKRRVHLVPNILALWKSSISNLLNARHRSQFTPQVLSVGRIE